MVHRPPDHQRNQLRRRRVGDIAGADRAAIAEDGIVVGDLEDLLELVADEEDRLALALQLADDRVKLLDLLVRQRRGRLVHNDDLRIHGEGARDGHQMLARNRQIAEPRVGIEIDLQLVENLARTPAHRFPVEEAETVDDRMAEEDVFGDGQIVEQHRLLVGAGDAEMERGLGIGDCDRLAIKADLALVGRIDTGENLDQRGLAGAVLADQRRDGARIELEIDLLQRLHAGKGFRDADRLEDGAGGRRGHADGFRSQTEARLHRRPVPLNRRAGSGWRQRQEGTGGGVNRLPPVGRKA